MRLKLSKKKIPDLSQIPSKTDKELYILIAMGMFQIGMLNKIITVQYRMGSSNIRWN
jgi:hypothetical protein